MAKPVKKEKDTKELTPMQRQYHAIKDQNQDCILFFLWFIPITGGECQIQLSGCNFGILVKHFIKVTQSKKQNAVLIALFDGMVLPLHGGEFFGRFCHTIYPLPHNASFRMQNAK